ncbi:MAG: DNA/RNA non-specific endonuclease [Bacteroidales bacterium]|nr:DNA/RNA non-specific endonuclease [Bacteroidales bacterium]
MGSAGATLLGTFSGATGTIYETGFYWGTSSGNLSEQVTDDGSNSSSGNFSCELTSLSESTTYYYKAYVLEYDASTSQYEEHSGTVKSFTTTDDVPAVPTGWLELPAITGTEDYVGVFYGEGGTTEEYRNYSYNYSYTYYASLWTAYPLTKAHTTGSASTSSWRYNPNIDYDKQVYITKNSYGTMYGDDTYSRGHQCPNADRKSDDTMNRQTYYATNQTPQIQTNFNQGIWSSLEEAERSLVSSNASEVVYVITGPAYKTVGNNETIHYLTGATGKNANPTQLPIPNYYWKAFLKVKWSGNTVTSASAIGFWFEHKTYSSQSYTSYAKSVDYIEQMTGLDLFTNLPGDNDSGIEKSAESNTSWTTFQNF